MSRWSSRRGSSRSVTRARRLAVAAIGATLLAVLVGAGAASAASAAANGDPSPHSAFVVQHDAPIGIGASNGARSHRQAVAGACLFVSLLAAISAIGAVARGRTAPRHDRRTLYARLRAPPVHLVVTY